MKLLQFLNSIAQKVQSWGRVFLSKSLKNKSRLYVVQFLDEFPNNPQPFILYVLGERHKEWLGALVCPCDCGDLIELVLDGYAPKWKLSITPTGQPSLYPSIYRSVKCRSHFFLKGGLIKWCA